MEVKFIEKMENQHPTTIHIEANAGVCYSMLRFLCNEAITRVSQFEVQVIKE